MRAVIGEGQCPRLRGKVGTGLLGRPVIRHAGIRTGPLLAGADSRELHSPEALSDGLV